MIFVNVNVCAKQNSKPRKKRKKESIFCTDSNLGSKSLLATELWRFPAMNGSNIRLHASKSLHVYTYMYLLLQSRINNNNILDKCMDMCTVIILRYELSEYFFDFKDMPFSFIAKMQNK